MCLAGVLNYLEINESKPDLSLYLSGMAAKP